MTKKYRDLLQSLFSLVSSDRLEEAKLIVASIEKEADDELKAAEAAFKRALYRSSQEDTFFG